VNCRSKQLFTKHNNAIHQKHTKSRQNDKQDLSLVPTDLSAQLADEMRIQCRDRDTARFNVPPNTLQIISETGFYRSNEPINSVKALKEDKS